MAGLVFDLQADAMNRAVGVSDLLRKAKAVSKKLRTPEVYEWIDRELNGYEKTATFPSIGEFTATSSATTWCSSAGSR